MGDFSLTDQDLVIRFPVAERVTQVAKNMEQQDFWCLAAVLSSFGYPADLKDIRMESPTPRAMAAALKALSGNGLHAVPVSPEAGIWTVTTLGVLLAKVSRMTAPLAILGPYSLDPALDTGHPKVSFALITGYAVTPGKDGINGLELLGCLSHDGGGDGPRKLPVTRRIDLVEAVRQLNGPDGKMRGLVMISSPAHTPDLADRAIASGLGAGWWPGA